MIMARTLFLIGSLLLCPMTVQAASGGEQTFQFLFKTGDVLWIAEDIGGQYELSALHQVAVSGDGVAAGQSELKTYRHWQPIVELESHFRTRPVVKLEPMEGGLWGQSELQWTIGPPDEDPALTAAFNQHVYDGGSNAETFYAEDNAPAKHLPTVAGAKAEPLYFSGRGLYFNYTIDSAYFFPRSGLLLVFTHQSITAVGLDTMHGFIVMQINSDRQ